MKRILFIFSLLLCLLSVPVTGFAAETDEEQVKYEDATTNNMKEMLKGIRPLTVPTVSDRQRKLPCTSSSPAIPLKKRSRSSRKTRKRTRRVWIRIPRRKRPVIRS